MPKKHNQKNSTDEPVSIPIERPWGLALVLLIPSTLPGLFALAVLVTEGPNDPFFDVEFRPDEIPLIALFILFQIFAMIRGSLALYDAIRGASFVFTEEMIVVPRCRLLHFLTVRFPRREFSGLKIRRKPLGATIKWTGGSRGFHAVDTKSLDELVEMFSGKSTPKKAKKKARKKSTKRIVRGRHLIELGLEQGPQMGLILDACFEAQKRGIFKTLDDGLNYAREIIDEQSENSENKRS